MTGNIFFLILVCVCLSAVGAWLVGRYGHHMDLLDQPNDRGSHSDVTPKGGGIGMLVAFMASAILLRIPVFLWAPTALLSFISLVGDRWHLSPIIRLLFQFGASFACLTGLWNSLPWATTGYLMIIPFALYIVGTTNYYNFMDGINGLAAITGIIGFGLVAFYGAHWGTFPDATILTVCMVFCCLGFLPFNMPNAKVFMGDVGSILLGFIYAVMVVRFSVSLASFLCLASFLFPFYADEITTEFVRLKKGEKLWLPHRKHLYQILANEYNISHWKISLGYGIAQLLVGASILLVFEYGVYAIFFLLLLHFFIFSLVSIALRRNVKSV